MNFDFVTQIETCHSFINQNKEFLSFVYWSHIPTAVTSLLVGFFVFFKDRKALVNKTLLGITVAFSLWTCLDLIIWNTYDSRIITLAWSLLGIPSVLISIFCFYFVCVFIDKKDISIRRKVSLGFLMMPIILLTPTFFNVENFDITNCQATEGSYFSNWYYLVGFSTSLWIFIFAILNYRKFDSDFKKQMLFLVGGVELFLISFFATGFVNSYLVNTGFITDVVSFKIEQYGLFGMTIFLTFLAYLIVKFKAFEIRMLAAEALVAGLVILLFSEFFFIGIEDVTVTVLISVTVLLATIFGIWLINSVRGEVKRKEELQSMSDQLAKANEQLKKLDNAKSEFISIASHQLRTPLTAIKGYVSLINEGTYGNVDPKIKDALSKTYVANERLIHLVEDLLNVSRIESGRMEFDMQPQQVENIIKNLADNFVFAAKKNGLYLNINLPEAPLPPVKIDKAKITEVLSNMIDNSIKYTKKGGVTVRVEHGQFPITNNPQVAEQGSLRGRQFPNNDQKDKLQTTNQEPQTGDVVRVTVSDTGIGIPAENLPYLFAKFSRGKDTSKLHASGTGLGMYVAKNIMEAHQGKIWAESEGENKGSRFIVELPVG